MYENRAKAGGQVCYAPTCLPWLGIQNLI